jgi:ribosome-associated protein
METDHSPPKSRTQLKKEALALQKLGERLVRLSDEQLDRMSLPSQLTAAIRDIRQMTSHGARRRQMQHIGGLMRCVDVAPIQQALTEIEQGAYQQRKAFRRVEGWRNRLVAGDDELMMDLLREFPEADRQRLGQLVRSARKEIQNDRPHKSSCNLFRYLKELAGS